LELLFQDALYLCKTPKLYLYYYLQQKRDLKSANIMMLFLNLFM